MSNTKNEIFDKGTILKEVLHKFSVQSTPEQLEEVEKIISSTSNLIEILVKKENKTVTKRDSDQFVYYLLLHILSITNYVKGMKSEETDH